MSTALNKLNAIFLIILLKLFRSAFAAPIYYDDYNSFELNDKDLKDYWKNDEPSSNEPTNDGVNYFQKCKPISQSTTTNSPFTTAAACSHSTTEVPAPEEYKDVVDHVITILASMRNHAVALIRSLNQLEMDMLSSPSADPLRVYQNSTAALSETVNGMKETMYPDILSQINGYGTKEWTFPTKIDSIPDTGQTNEFVAEAQEAVKSWKKQIESCKTILDNAVYNALRKANIKSSLMSDPMGRENNTNNSNSLLYNKLHPSTLSSKDMPRDLVNEERLRNYKNYKYHSLYDAFRTKDDNY